MQSVIFVVHFPPHERERKFEIVLLSALNALSLQSNANARACEKSLGTKVLQIRLKMLQPRANNLMRYVAIKSMQGREPT